MGAYVGTNLKLNFNTQADLTDVHEIIIEATSPTGVSTQLTPTSFGDSIVVYDSDVTDFTEAGVWKFYLWVTYEDGRIAESELAKLNLSRKGA
jgi:hypothetical protein